MNSAVSERISRAVAIAGGRIANLMAQVAPEPGEIAAQGATFLWSCYEAAAHSPASSHGLPHPIDLLTRHFELSPLEVDFLLLAGMAEEHEGYSAVLRSLHPRGE